MPINPVTLPDIVVLLSTTDETKLFDCVKLRLQLLLLAPENVDVGATADWLLLLALDNVDVGTTADWLLLLAPENVDVGATAD